MFFDSQHSHLWRKKTVTAWVSERGQPRDPRMGAGGLQSLLGVETKLPGPEIHQK